MNKTCWEQAKDVYNDILANTVSSVESELANIDLDKSDKFAKFGPPFSTLVQNFRLIRK